MTRVLKKRALFSNEISYLGIATNTGRLEIANHTVDAISTFKRAHMVMDLVSIIWLGSLFRWFVLIFARFAALPTKRLMTNQPTILRELVDDVLEALASLKKKPDLATNTSAPTIREKVHARYRRMQQ